MLVDAIISLFLIACVIMLFIFETKIRIKRVRKEGLSKNDFKFDKGYYTGILKEYSPIELSYLDNMQLIDLKNAIIATLLNLKLKNKIEITERGIKVLDKEDEKLSDNEKHILEHVSVGRVELVKDTIIEEYAHNELIEKGLIQKVSGNKRAKNQKKDLIMTILDKVCAIVLMFFLMVLNINVYTDNNFLIELYKVVSMVLIFLCIVSISTIPILGLVIVWRQLLRDAYSYERTEKGEEINLKLEGLKKYIKEYGSFEDKEKETLILWEEYLVYSVIFGVNTKVYEDIEKFVVLTQKPKNYTRYHY